MSVDDAQNLKLLAIDWDGTVSPVHMNLFVHQVFNSEIHSPIIYRNGIPPEDQLGRFFNPKYSPSTKQFQKWFDHTPLPKAGETVHLIKTSVEKGLKIAIVTLCRFPDAIYSILQYMGVELEILANVVVVCNGYTVAERHGYTENMLPVSKNPHIELAMKYFGIDIGNKKSVLYVDDSKPFIESASAVGYNTILAMPEQEWIGEAQRYVNATAEVDGATPMLTAEGILEMNMQICTQWDLDYPIMQAAVQVQVVITLGPLTLKKKPSVSDIKKPDNPDDVVDLAPDVVAYAASLHPEVALLAVSDDV